MARFEILDYDGTCLMHTDTFPAQFYN